MQRLTKYPLLLDNIIKYTDGERSKSGNPTGGFQQNSLFIFFSAASSADLPALQRAQTCCRRILQNVNENVRESERQQRLSQYQRRLDPGPQFKVNTLVSRSLEPNLQMT